MKSIYEMMNDINDEMSLTEDVGSTKYTAEFTPYGESGTRILVASDIHELISNLIEGGYKFNPVSKKELFDWETSNKKKFYARNLTVRRGEDEMTDYTSL